MWAESVCPEPLSVTSNDVVPSGDTAAASVCAHSRFFGTAVSAVVCL